MSTRTEVLIKVVVDSDIDPRNEHGELPYEFKHLDRHATAAPVKEYTGHLLAKARAAIERGEGEVIEYTPTEESP